MSRRALAAARPGRRPRRSRAEDWPQFRGPTGQGHSGEAGLPLEWSESQNVVWKTPVPGLRLVVAGRRRRPRLADDGGQRAAAASLRALAFDVETGTRGRRTSRSFALRSADPINPKNSLASPTPIVDGDRVYVHFGADGTAALTVVRRDRLEDAAALRVAARQRRIAGAVTAIC